MIDINQFIIDFFSTYFPAYIQLKTFISIFILSSFLLSK